jgi:nucleotide-binding universal stress UspA family protein
METFSNILVAIDLSKNCLPALKLALKMKEDTKSKVTFFYVLPSSGEEVGSFRSLYRSDVSADKLLANYVFPRMETWLTKIKDGLLDEGKIAARVGEPAKEIIDYAENNNIDLIVLGTHGRSGFKRLWIGSVAEEVVRSSQCPVLTVRSKGDTTARIITD